MQSSTLDGRVLFGVIGSSGGRGCWRLHMLRFALRLLRCLNLGAIPEQGLHARMRQHSIIKFVRGGDLWLQDGPTRRP